MVNIAYRCLGEMFPASISLEIMSLRRLLKINPAYNPNSKVSCFLFYQFMMNACKP